jgi:hypothetical protein
VCIYLCAQGTKLEVVLYKCDIQIVKIYRQSINMRFELIVLMIYSIMDVGPAHDLIPQCSALLVLNRGKPATDQPP